MMFLLSFQTLLESSHAFFRQSDHEVLDFQGFGGEHALRLQ